MNQEYIVLALVALAALYLARRAFARFRAKGGESPSCGCGCGCGCRAEKKIGTEVDHDRG